MHSDFLCVFFATVTAPTIQLTSATPPAPMAPMQMTQLPQHIQAAAAFPPAVTPMPQRPAFYPPMLYWYPSPPVSPQTFFTHPGPCAIVMRGLPYNVTVTDVVNYFQGFPEVGRKLGRMNTFDLLCACTRVLLKLPPFFFFFSWKRCRFGLGLGCCVVVPQSDPP